VWPIARNGPVSHPAQPLEVSEAVATVANTHARASSLEYRMVVRARIICAAVAGVSREACRERAAMRNKAFESARQARAARKAAARDNRRAHKALLAAQAAVATAEADASRAAKGVPACFSTIWTHKALQQELERQTGQTMSLREIGRTLCCGGLRPHRAHVVAWSGPRVSGEGEGDLRPIRRSTCRQQGRFHFVYNPAPRLVDEPGRDLVSVSCNVAS
jgi:hypothetical protein